MALYKARGIVLKSIKLGEADKIVSIYSPTRGKIRAVAKGVRKTKSKFGSRLEPFTHVDMLLYEGRDLDIVTQAEIISSFKEIRSDLDKLKYGSVMLELTEKVGQEGQESEDVFGCLLAGLKALKAATGRLPLLLGVFELKLMSAAGFHPHVRDCTACGHAAGEGRAAFSFRYGGLLCAQCSGKDEDALVVTSGCVELVRAALRTSLARWHELEAKPACQSELFRLAQLFTIYYLERDLKSPRLLAM